MTHNGQGLLLCWYSVIRQPELLLSKVTEDENIFYSSALFVQPGLQMISEQDDQYIFVSQHLSAVEDSRKPMLPAVLFCQPAEHMLNRI